MVDTDACGPDKVYTRHTNQQHGGDGGRGGGKERLGSERKGEGE